MKCTLNNNNQDSDILIKGNKFYCPVCGEELTTCGYSHGAKRSAIILIIDLVCKKCHFDGEIGLEVDI